MLSRSQPIKATAYKENKKAPFIEAFCRIGTDVGASRAVGISRYAVMDWKKNDPEFKKKYDLANTDFVDRIETVVHDKALGGDLGACIFLLRARAPHKYTERFKHEVEFAQIERIIGAFSSLIKQNVPQERWQTVSAQLQTLAAQYKIGQAPVVLMS